MSASDFFSLLIARSTGRSAVCSHVALIALVSIVSGLPAPIGEARADSRAAAYSIHMLAHIPSRCTLRDVRRLVHLTRETDAGEIAWNRGSARFRVECNVPYFLDTSSRLTAGRPRARMIPLASSDTDEIAAPTEDAATALASSQCMLTDPTGRHNAECPSRTDAAPALVLARATAELQLSSAVFADHPAETINAASPADTPQHDDTARIVAVEIGGRP